MSALPKWSLKEKFEMHLFTLFMFRKYSAKNFLQVVAFEYQIHISMHYPNNGKKYKKKECWFDGLTQELLITGVPNLAAPLPVTIIQSIENGKFPAFCKEAYVSNPGTSKG